MNDLEFLRLFMAKLQATYQLTLELTEADFNYNREPPALNENDELERVARIAYRLGFNGKLFLTLYRDNSDGWLMRAHRKTRQQIRILPRIIARLEQPMGESEMSTIIERDQIAQKAHDTSLDLIEQLRHAIRDRKLLLRRSSSWCPAHELQHITNQLTELMGMSQSQSTK